MSGRRRKASNGKLTAHPRSAAAHRWARTGPADPRRVGRRARRRRDGRRGRDRRHVRRAGAGFGGGRMPRMSGRRRKASNGKLTAHPRSAAAHRWARTRRRCGWKWRISNPAGFEGGTKIHVNTIDPWELRRRAVETCHSSFVGTCTPVAACSACSRSETARMPAAECSCGRFASAVPAGDRRPRRRGGARRRGDRRRRRVRRCRASLPRV
jgi:hypothetical protein